MSDKPIKEIATELWESFYALTIERDAALEKIARIESALVKAKRMTDHIFEKGNVNWGQTFVKWDIMNEGLIAMDEIESILEGR